MIKIKRVYEDPETDDGVRFLVDRIWPRGVKKSAINPGAWLKNVAPSDPLRRWFGHDPANWDEFKRRYFAELDSKENIWQDMITRARKGDVTLLYSAAETRYNNAAALKEYLEKQIDGNM